MKPKSILILILLFAFITSLNLSCKKEDYETGKVNDIDGNKYKTVKIGQQTWMAENLKTTKLNDGSDIQLVTDDDEWEDLTTSGYCIYENDMEYVEKYGALYNWYAVNTNKLCPSGWHVPSDDEWTEMEIYLQNNGYNYDGFVDSDNDRETNNNIAKSLASLEDWWGAQTVEGSPGNESYPEYRNKTGFNAFPAGERNSVTGKFENLRLYTNFWTSTDSEDNSYKAYTRELMYFHTILDRYEEGRSKGKGYSVRCIKD